MARTPALLAAAVAAALALVATPATAGAPAVPAAPAFGTETSSTGLGVAPPPNPASGLRLLRSDEAGHQTLDTTTDLLIQKDTTVEPSIAVDPVDPQHVVIGYQMGRDDAGGDISNGFATSLDGGATWTVGTVPGLTTFDPASPAGTRAKRGSDAVVAFGTKDAATGKTLVYYSSLIFDPTSTNTYSAIVNSTSHDGGLTWDLPTVVQADDGGGLNDKNWLVVDRGTGAGHHPGRVYVVWDRIAGVIAKYSDDAGKTWVGPPSPAYLPNVYASQGIGALPVVLPNGALAVAFLSSVAPPPVGTSPGDELTEAMKGVSRVVVAVSPLAGSTPTGTPLVFEEPISVTAFQGAKVRAQRAAGLVSAEVDPVTGRFYVTVEDSKAFRTDGRNDVVIAYSDNLTGATPSFSSPVRVNGGPPADQVDRYNPAVAVGPGSTVRVMWRQRQETASSDRNTYDPIVTTWVAQSSTGGASWSPALRLDRAINDVRFGAFSRGGTFQGDYNQLATATDGTTYVVHGEAVQLDPSEVPPATPSATTLHHQRMWVTSVAADTGPAAVVPELPRPWLGLLAAAALCVAVLLLRRRRGSHG